MNAHFTMPPSLLRQVVWILKSPWLAVLRAITRLRKVSHSAAQAVRYLIIYLSKMASSVKMYSSRMLSYVKVKHRRQKLSRHVLHVWTESYEMQIPLSVREAKRLKKLPGLVLWLAIAIVARMAVAGVAAWAWHHSHSYGEGLSDANYWLPARWLVGFIAPLILTALAAATARIRSTQSATGILYVVVICVFLGELLGMLLLTSTGYPL